VSNLSRGGDYRYDKPTSIGEPEKVTSWPFKEPEKKSAWKDEPKELPGARFMVDTEGEKRKKAKKAIRDAMSPPGALKLSPALEAQRQKFGIPDGVFRAAAGFDRILVYPIDPFDDDEHIPGSIFYKPKLTQLKDLQEGYRAVLISAGLSAMDRLASHGYELGDIVLTNKNVPFARRCQQIPDVGDIYVLVMRDGDLAGNETLQDRIDAGQARVADVGGEDGYCHQIERLVDGEWTTRKKQSTYVADSW
jgi:hypothetical protein